MRAARVAVMVLLGGCGTEAVSSSENPQLCGVDDTKYVESYGDQFNSLDVTYDMIERRVGGTGTLYCPHSDVTFCSGTLISGNLFLTAAHCLNPTNCLLGGSPTDPDDPINGWEVAFGYRIEGRPAEPGFGDLHDFSLVRITDVAELGDPDNVTAPDYAILELDGLPGWEHGYAPLRDRRADLNEPVWMIGYPDRVFDFEASDPVTVAAGSVTDDDWVEPGTASPMFGHTVDAYNGSSGSPLFDADGYVLGVHTLSGCETPVLSNFAEPMDAIFAVSPILQGQTGAGFDYLFDEDRLLVSVFDSAGHQTDTFVSFDSYVPSYRNAEAQAAVYSPDFGVRAVGSVSDDHSEHHAAVTRVVGKFVLGRYVLNTGAVGLGGDDERFLDAAIARDLFGEESALMAVGYVKTGADRRVLVTAFSPDATALSTAGFGQTATGFTITDVPTMTDEVASAVFSRSVLEHYVSGNGVLPSGRRGFFLARYDGSGAVDSSFGSSGFTVFDPGAGFEAAVVEAIVSAGDLVFVVGHRRAEDTGQRVALIASFRRDTGALKGFNTFDGSSLWTTIGSGFLQPTHVEARDVGIDTQGRLTMAGVARYWNEDRLAYVGRTFTRRYLPSPLLSDSSYSGGVWDAGGGFAALDIVARAVAVAPSGGAAVAADSTMFPFYYDQMGIVYLFGATGNPDPNFTGDGVTVWDVNNSLEMRYSDIVVSGATIAAVGKAEINPLSPPGS